LIVGDQRPRQCLLGETLRHGYAEYVLVPADKKMGWLPAIRLSRRKIVVRTDRDVRFFLVITVHVAEPHVEGSVLVYLVTFIDRGNSLARPVPELDELRRCVPGQSEKDDEGAHQILELVHVQHDDIPALREDPAKGVLCANGRKSGVHRLRQGRRELPE